MIADTFVFIVKPVCLSLLVIMAIEALRKGITFLTGVWFVVIHKKTTAAAAADNDANHTEQVVFT